MKRRVWIAAAVLLLGGAVVLLRKPVKSWYKRITYEVSTGRFQDPEGLAVDGDGNVYVADEDRALLWMLDKEGKDLARIDFVEGYALGRITSGDSMVAVGPGHVVVIAQFNLAELKFAGGKATLLRTIDKGKGAGPDEMGDPEGISRDPANGDLYVTDEDNRRVKVFDREGKPLRTWPVPDDPEGIYVHGDRVYVTFSKDDWVGCFSKEGQLKFRFGRSGSGAGDVDEPDYVCVSPDGLLYVTEQSNHRIQVFDLDGRHRFFIGGPGKGPAQFNEPEDLAFDREGNLYVADGGNHRIQVLTRDGKFLREIR